MSKIFLPPRHKDTKNYNIVLLIHRLPGLNVLMQFKQGAPVGSREIAGKLNIHQNTALKRLRQLEEKGLIHKQGSGPRVRYSV